MAVQRTVGASESCSTRRAPGTKVRVASHLQLGRHEPTTNASADPPLAARRNISIASATTLPLFEDPSVENRHPTLSILPLPSFPRAPCASLYLSFCCFVVLATVTRILESSTLHPLPGYRNHRHHGCPKVLSMDVRTLPGHLAAHCREPHSGVRLPLCW